MSREEAAAVRGYEIFHGGVSEKVITDRVQWPPPAELIVLFPCPRRLPEWVSALGELLWVSYEKELEDGQLLEEEVLEFKKPFPLLCSDFTQRREGDESLYIVGGSYKAHQEDDLICGNLIRLGYLSVKSFDDFTPTEYVHRLDSPWPVLAQSVDRKQLYIFRDESEFYIERSGNVSMGISG